MTDSEKLKILVEEVAYMTEWTDIVFVHCPDAWHLRETPGQTTEEQFVYFGKYPRCPTCDSDNQHDHKLQKTVESNGARFAKAALKKIGLEVRETGSEPESK